MTNIYEHVLLCFRTSTLRSPPPPEASNVETPPSRWKRAVLGQFVHGNQAWRGPSHLRPPIYPHHPDPCRNLHLHVHRVVIQSCARGQGCVLGAGQGGTFSTKTIFILFILKISNLCLFKINFLEACRGELIAYSRFSSPCQLAHPSQRFLP